MAKSDIDIRLKTQADDSGINKLENRVKQFENKKVSVKTSESGSRAKITDTKAKVSIAEAAEEARRTAMRALLALSKAKIKAPEKATEAFANLSKTLKNINPVNIPKTAAAMAQLEKSLDSMSGLQRKYAEKIFGELKEQVGALGNAAKAAADEVKGAFSGGDLISSLLSGDIRGIGNQLFNLLGTVKKFPNFLKGIGNMGVGQLAIIYKGIESYMELFNGWLDRTRGKIRDLANNKISNVSDGIELAQKQMERLAFFTDLANKKLLNQIEIEKSRRQAFEAIAAAQTDREEAEAMTGSRSDAERNAIETRFRAKRERAAEEAARAELSENRRADEATLAANAKKMEARRREIEQMERQQAELGRIQDEATRTMDDMSWLGQMMVKHGMSDYNLDDASAITELQKRIMDSIVAANDALKTEEADQAALQSKIDQYAVQERALVEKEVASAAARAKDREDRRIQEEAVLVAQHRRERDLALEEERSRESVVDADSERGMGLQKQIENAERRAKDRAQRYADADKEYSDFMKFLGDRAKNENDLTAEEKSKRDDLLAQRNRFRDEMNAADADVKDKKLEMENALRAVAEEKTDRDYAQREADIEAEQQRRIRRGGTMAQFRVAQENVARREEELKARRAERDELRRELQKKYGANASVASFGSEDRRRWDRAVSRVIETTNNLRSARSEMDAMTLERQKAISGQMLEGARQSNRLTAMGLAGDVAGWNRDTARNTGRMVTLLEQNLRLRTGGGSSRPVWSLQK